jgi:trans-aconitate methyltransferase
LTSPRSTNRDLGSDAWFAYVEHVVETLDVGPGTSVFEVGCQAGEFLFPLSENGFTVGGIDPSPELIARARQMMPLGRWSVGEPSTLDPGEPWTVVVSSAFEQFRDLDYARGVIARMATKASHAIALLELTEKYDRGWMLRALNEVGVRAVEFEPREHRYDVFARI